MFGFCFRFSVPAHIIVYTLLLSVVTVDSRQGETSQILYEEGKVHK